MPWQTLTPGALNATASIPGIDPNLVWADATDFVDFARAVEDARPGPPSLLPVIIELKPHAGALAALRNDVLLAGGSVPGIYRGTPGAPIGYCTAMVPPSQVKQWLAGMASGVLGTGSPVARFELQMPLIPQRPRVEAPIAASTEEARAQVSGKRLLIGVIDSGCPFAHRQLLDRGGSGTRVLGLWDQNENSGLARVGGYRPRDLGYGCEISQARLNDLIAKCSSGGVVCEDTCYSTAGYREMSRRMAHGAAVLGLLAGDVPLTLKASSDPDAVPQWTELEGEAVRDADIAFVQLPRDAVQDSSSAGLTRLLLDGLRYILSLAGKETEHIVVNLSEGSSRGTHDGASIFEEALRALVAEDPRLKIVIAAGNTYDEQRHAVLGGRGGVPGPVTFRLPPGCESAAAVVVRMPNVAGLALRVTTPDGADVLVNAGEAKGWPAVGSVACAVIYPARPPEGEAHLALIAWRPTELEAGGWQNSFAGDWKIGLSPAQPADPVHFYVCRNQANPGALPRATQGAFVDTDETYDPWRSIRSSRNDASATESPIRRRGGLTALSTVAAQPRITVAGGYIHREGEMCLYSSEGPAAGATGPRPGPDRNAPADDSFSLPGIRVAGSRSGDTVRVRGTSFAAPQVARLIADQSLLPSTAIGSDLGLWVSSFDAQSLLKRGRKKP